MKNKKNSIIRWIATFTFLANFLSFLLPSTSRPATIALPAWTKARSSVMQVPPKVVATPPVLENERDRRRIDFLRGLLPLKTYSDDRVKKLWVVLSHHPSAALRQDLQKAALQYRYSRIPLTPDNFKFHYVAGFGDPREVFGPAIEGFMKNPGQEFGPRDFWVFGKGRNPQEMIGRSDVEWNPDFQMCDAKNQGNEGDLPLSGGRAGKSAVTGPQINISPENAPEGLTLFVGCGAEAQGGGDQDGGCEEKQDKLAGLRAKITAGLMSGSSDQASRDEEDIGGVPAEIDRAAKSIKEWWDRLFETDSAREAREQREQIDRITDPSTLPGASQKADTSKPEEAADDSKEPEKAEEDADASKPKEKVPVDPPKKTDAKDCDNDLIEACGRLRVDIETLLRQIWPQLATNGQPIRNEFLDKLLGRAHYLKDEEFLRSIYINPNPLAEDRDPAEELGPIDTGLIGPQDPDAPWGGSNPGPLGKKLTIDACGHFLDPGLCISVNPNPEGDSICGPAPRQPEEDPEPGIGPQPLPIHRGISTPSRTVLPQRTNFSGTREGYLQRGTGF